MSIQIKAIIVALLLLSALCISIGVYLIVFDTGGNTTIAQEQTTTGSSDITSEEPIIYYC